MQSDSGSVIGNTIEEYAKAPVEFVVAIIGPTGNVMDLNTIVSTEMYETIAEKLVTNARIHAKKGIRLFLVTYFTNIGLVFFSAYANVPFFKYAVL